MPSPSRLPIALSALLLTLTVGAFHRIAAQTPPKDTITVRVGGVSLLIPPPSGTRAISREAAMFKTVQATLPAFLRLEGAFYPVAVATTVEAGLTSPRGPFFQLQINTQIEDKRLSSSDFAELGRESVKEIKASGNMADAIGKEAVKAGERLSASTGTEVKLNPGQMEFLEPHAIEPRIIGFSFRMGFQVAIGGRESETDSMTGSAAMTHVRGKVIQLYAYVPGTGDDALASSRKAAKEWAAAVIAANPSSRQDEVSNVRTGFDWGQALKRGAIGGFVGAVIGLFLWVKKKRAAARERSP